MNLDAYLRRIGHDGALEPTLAVLRLLAFRHATTIAFENLNPYLGLPVDLSIDALQDKVVEGQRGGYCFEHNLLLAQALEQVGFKVTRLAARVLWTQPEDAITMRSHMLLRVDVDEGPHVVDVGFGGLTLTGALALHDGVEQETPHEPFRLVQRDGDWWMQARLHDAWATLYRFDLQRQYPIDYEAANHYLCTHPSSHFIAGLRIALPTPEGRHALRGRELAFHRLGGESERRTLADVADLRGVLEGTFRLRLPEVPQLTERLDAVFAD